MAETTFNPLDKRNLGESVAGALLRRSIGPLPPAIRFTGAGIYAIYYTGSLKVYGLIAERNRNGRFERPIYVGKAVPPGARKGGFGLGTAPGSALFNRLREHSKSITACASLKLDDFHCRYLVSDDIWIPLGEALLIENFKPLWNVLLDGFGNHPTGKRRATQYRSRWDMFHPGREWAARLPDNPENPARLEKRIVDFLQGKDVQIISIEEAVMAEESGNQNAEDEE